MQRLRFSWIGATDLKASSGGQGVGLSPIAQSVTQRPFDKVVLLCDYPQKDGKAFVKWLFGHSKASIDLKPVSLSGATHFGEIYENASKIVQEELQGFHGAVDLTFHLSPGTPAMAAVWILLAKTRFPAELIESSKEHSVRTASVPFDLSAEYLPDLLRKPDEELRRFSEGLPPEAPEFDDIVHRCLPMKRVISRARRAAPRNVPVLILGDSGTGKELLARAIHMSSPRKGKPFIAVNCGAIPHSLAESALFGHEKGAFTGALKTTKGFIEEVAARRFREDLFHRLAVAVLSLPPLREREGDLGLLIDHSLKQVNEEGVGQPGFKHKTLSTSARSLLLKHDWPGNVRELFNTLRRAALWSTGSVIDDRDISESILPLRRKEEAWSA